MDETVDFPLHISPLGGQLFSMRFVDSFNKSFGFVQVNFEVYIFPGACFVNLIHLILLVSIDLHLLFHVK